MEKSVTVAASEEFVYQVRHPGNGDFISIDSRVRFPEMEASYFKFAEDLEDSHPLYVALKKIGGVESAYSHGYDLTIEKAKLFTWVELIPQILEAIQKNFAGDRVMTSKTEDPSDVIDRTPEDSAPE